MYLKRFQKLFKKELLFFSKIWLFSRWPETNQISEGSVKAFIKSFDVPLRPSWNIFSRYFIYSISTRSFLLVWWRSYNAKLCFFSFLKKHLSITEPNLKIAVTLLSILKYCHLFYSYSATSKFPGWKYFLKESQRNC